MNRRIGIWLVAIATTALCMVATPRRLEAGESGAYLLKQWNTTVPVVRHSCPSVLGNVGGRLVFLATTPQEGRSLWSTDGTADGTTMLNALVPGFGGPVSSQIRVRGKCSDRLFLSVEHGATGVSWWCTDGTADGTWRIGGLPSPRTDSLPSEFFEFGGTTYGAVRTQLYEIDLVNRVAVELGGTYLGELLGVSGPKVVYHREDPFDRNPEVWSYDVQTGTFSATADLVTGIQGQASGIYSGPLELERGVVFCVSDHSSDRNCLAISDGTTSNTLILAEFTTDEQISNVAGVTSGQAYVQSGNNIWVTDGTVEGTGLVFESSTASGFGISRETSSILNGKLIAQFYSTSNSQSILWTSDGTPEGTRPFFTGTPPFNREFNAGPVIDGVLYFTAGRTNAPYLGLWVTDGTEEGTVALTDFGSTSPNSNCADPRIGPEAVIPSSGSFVLAGFSKAQGNEPWISDGTTEGTVILKNVAGEDYSSDPYFWANANGLSFLQAKAGASTSLVRTDGTTGGSFPILTPLNGPPGLGIGDYLLFMQSSSPPGNDTDYRLYRTDGTPSGTVPIQTSWNGRKMVYLDSNFGDGRRGCFMGFTRNPAPQSNPDWLLEGWISAGEVDATIRFHSMTLTTPIYSFPKKVYGKSLGERFYYSTETTSPFLYPLTPLWQTDGTTSGTLNLLPDVEQSVVSDFACLGDRILFTRVKRDDYDNTLQVCSFSPGDELPTVLATHRQNLGSAYSPFERFARLGDRAYFLTATYYEADYEQLWSTDGTVEGTVLVKSFSRTDGVSVRSDAVRPIIGAGSLLLFPVNDGYHGEELWATDGTPEGTRLVKDINPGEEGSYISSMVSRGGVIYFAASNRESGAELWRSDGTEQGTYLLADIAPGPSSSNPSSLAILGNQLLLTATDGSDKGYQTWAVDLPPLEESGWLLEGPACP